MARTKEAKDFIEVSIKDIQQLENIRTRIKFGEIQELMQNIKQQGLLQPIGVWETPSGEYVIAYGNRRLVACDKLGWRNIPAKLLGELDYEEMLIVNTSENLHRKEITVAEFGRVCDMLKNKGLSKGEIGVRLGVPPKRVDDALNVFKKIPLKHRKDIIFMKGGEKHKLGKVPASLFNRLISLQQEQSLSNPDIDKLIQAVKQQNLSTSQIQVVSALIRDGATINQALKELDKYAIRRITLPVNRKVEKSLLEENKLTSKSGKFAHIFRKIMNGEIRGRKGYVFTGKNNGNGKKNVPVT